MYPIEIVPYDPTWKAVFESHATPIQEALGTNCLSVHHIGSTAVEGLSAKPKVDILAVVSDLSRIDIQALERLGFEYRGEVIPKGRYLSKKSPRIHLHIFQENSPRIEEYLLFRDWLRTNKSDREAYETLKKELSSFHNDGMEYAVAKTHFIQEIVKKTRKCS